MVTGETHAFSPPTHALHGTGGKTQSDVDRLHLVSDLEDSASNAPASHRRFLSADLPRSMTLLRERLELAADRLARQVAVATAAKMEFSGHVEEGEVLDASSFEETVHGRLGLVEHNLDRLESLNLNFGSTH